MKRKMNKLKKSLMILGMVSLALTSLVGCGKGNNSEKNKSTLEKETIIVGMELKYPPFETKNEKGDPEGASVMLAKAFGEYSGKEIKIVDVPYPSLITSLETGKIDMIISSMTITPAREERVDFSNPYTTSQLMMLVHKDSKVQSADDLNNSDVVIASKTGTIGALWAKENAPNATIKNVNEEASAVLEVAQGKADVFIYDPLSVIRHHENYPDTTRTVLEPLPNTKGWGVAVRKGESELIDKLNEFIKNAKEDGTYDEIREKYLKDKMKEFEEYGIDFFF
ncbi:transporter substrate-binding domain-containing protein [Oceanirhabdus sp. W0125-5]|uniref:transporter substrate-binding domain-containing protein n=1 Tax=Oceanirhabdus sp. W0125-5 TaxID=2999116 RepID=UPI0022F2D2DE|nr:transporter substrate-binding domain-containing protein [Oceanirhabdus sp. W0125-5]WBW97856.1 transporter substrate-binding domain-containing protein [Oceanirhabdus sp. W0125-5]